MHDTEPNPKIRMPPLMILGLTGPVGSGCTTVGKIFSTSKGFNKVLENLKWVSPRGNGGFDIIWDNINKEIDSKYEKLAEVNEIIKEYNDCKNKKDIRKMKELKKELGEILSKKLEVREEIKALEKLKQYHDENKHYFCTLSVSDLIVFRTLMEIENENFSLEHVEEIDKKTSYEEFVSIVKEHMNQKEVQKAITLSGSKGYADYHKKCYEYKSENEFEELGKYFHDINKVTKTIKDEYYQKYPYKYSNVMQDFGDNIRQCGDPFGFKRHPIRDTSYRLAKGIAQRIYLLFKTKQAAFFIVDCLRNPYEAIYLRREFANFYLFSLFADEKVRKERFIQSVALTLGKQTEDLTSEEKDRIVDHFEKTDKRDSGKGVKGDQVLYKQNVTKCVEISDIAISNEKKWERSLSERNKNIFLDFCRKPLRMLCLMLSPGCTKPNDDEMRMNMAYTMAVKSNCISRQVGAVIVGTDGYIVGAGWNDVGESKISCGLRAIRDLKIEEFKPLLKAIIRKEEKNTEDVIKRLIGIYKDPVYENIDQFCFCFKDEMAKSVITPRLVTAWHKKVDDLVEKLKSEKVDELKGVSEDTFEKAKKLAKYSGEKILKDLVEEGNLHQLEYCLALHAEENAIIQSSKIGGMGLKGGTIYTTAQPCPLCAKKIQQIGLKKVVYTEAYPASLSEVYMKGVDLEQFEGVKPRAYIKLFMPHHDQKEWQDLESQNLVPLI